MKTIDRPVSAVAAMVVAIVIALGAWWYAPVSPHRTWIAVGLLLVVFMMALGHSITGRFTGVLITEQNVMSLARFQDVLWTVIIVSAYLVIAFARIKSSDKLGKVPAPQTEATPAAAASP